MLSVQTNTSAISAQRQLNKASDNYNTSMERLSSGYRINRASDDAAGLAVSEKLKAQIGGLDQASRNSQDGISMIQTGEGALDEVQTMMQRMRTLAVQASSDTNSQTERDNINLEIGQLTTEINSMSTRTKFNGQSLLNGSLTTTQVTSATGYDTNATELAVSTTALTSGLTVSAISVADAQTAKGYTITGTVSTTDTNAGTLTMNQVDTNGTTTGVTQTISISDLDVGESEDLNFSELGIKITLSNPSTGGAVTAATIAGDFAGTSSIDTATGSGTAVLQTGANQGDETSVSFVNTRLSGTTGVAAMDDLSKALDTFQTTASRDNASSLITALDTALGSISSSRATLGAAQNRLQHTISSLGTTSENLSAANSRIRDVDTATESSNMSKSSVLEQAGVAVLAQANQIPQLALKLLQ
jgi:flagellin